jgi:hypothetical protein
VGGWVGERQHGGRGRGAPGDSPTWTLTRRQSPACGRRRGRRTGAWLAETNWAVSRFLIVDGSGRWNRHGGLDEAAAKQRTSQIFFTTKMRRFFFTPGRARRD